MFEQSLYETETVHVPEMVATPLENGDLFHTYELKNWEFTPRIYKILGIATALNLLALLIFAQTSVLTAKGCDSPFVGRVCDVLDTVYVGSLLFGTQREYVDAAYDKTELGDADITFVDVSGETPPLSYPEGYFQIANPNEYQAMLDQANNPAPSFDMSGFPPGIITTSPSMGNGLIDTKPVIPKSNPNVIDGNLPTIDDHTGLPSTPFSRPKGPGLGRVRPPRTTPVTPKPTPDPNAKVAEKKNDPPAKVDPADTLEDAKPDKNGIYLNKRPLTEYAEKTKPSNANITPDAIYKVVMTGELGPGKDKSGKEIKTIVLKNPKPVETVATNKASADMAKLTQDGILALGDSGWLGYLYTLGVKKVTITVIQDASDFKVTIQADQKDENTAKTVASGLNSFISIGKMATDGDEKNLLERATTTAVGKTFVLNFAGPKAEIIEMIRRKLAEPKKVDTSLAQVGDKSSVASK
jgi:hypothetical protein